MFVLIDIHKSPNGLDFCAVKQSDAMKDLDSGSDVDNVNFQCALVMHVSTNFLFDKRMHVIQFFISKWKN